MEHLFREARGERRAEFSAGLGLCVLLLLAGAGPASGVQEKKAGLRVEVEEGQTKLVKLRIRNECAAPHLFRVRRKAGGFLRLEPPSDSVLVEGKSFKEVGTLLDAAGLKAGRRQSGAIDVDCLDCEKEPGCGVGRDEIAVEMTVVINAIEAHLKNLLTVVGGRFERRVRELELIRGTHALGEAEGFDAEKVRAIIKEIREELLANLPQEELAALKHFIELRYDPPPLETLAVEVERTNAPPESNGQRVRTAARSYAAREPFEERVIATAASSNAAFRYVRGFLLNLRKNSGPITLRINSVPDGANVVLAARRGKQYASSTNSEIHNFYRGIYTITVAKSGYKTIAHGEQEVGFGHTSIECRLVSDGEAILCQFR